MAANITSGHGRDGDLAVNLCDKQQLSKGGHGEVLRANPLSGKLFTAQMGIPSEKFKLIYYSSAPPSPMRREVMKNGGGCVSISCGSLIHRYQKQ